MFKIGIEQCSKVWDMFVMNNVHCIADQVGCASDTGRMTMGVLSVTGRVVSIDWTGMLALPEWLDGSTMLQRFAANAATFYIGLAVMLVALAMVATLVERLGLEKSIAVEGRSLPMSVAALQMAANDNRSPVRDLPGGFPACSHAARFSVLQPLRHLRQA
jgi:hypothetical protein